MELKDDLTNLRQLLTKSENSRELWDILTALRGPDDCDELDKEATTGVIRWALLGYDAGEEDEGEKRVFWSSVFAPDSKEKAAHRRNMDRTHFSQHALRAFEALGLKWREVNW